MKPLRLTATGVACFATLDYDFPAGITAIVGKNGVGKSTLLNAVELALFADGSRDLAQLLGPDADHLEIELEFEHAGETYRVRQGYRETGSGGKATVDFECWKGTPLHTGDDTGPCWESLTRERADATRELICSTLGLSRKTFNASAFLAQGNAAAFPDASPSERKQMLGEILDAHGVWPKLADRAKLDAREAEKTLELLSAQTADREQRVANLPALQEQLSRIDESEANARALLAGAETILEHAQGELAGNAAAAQRVATVTLAREHAAAKHADAVQAVQRAEHAATQLPDARQLLLTLKAAAELIPDLETRLDEQRRQQAEAGALRDRLTAALRAVETDQERARRAHADHDQATRSLEAAQAKLEALRAAPDDEAHCDRCKQPLGAAARQDAIQSLAVECTKLEHEVGVKSLVAHQADELLAVARATAAEIQPPAIAEVEDILTPLSRAKLAADGIPTAEHNLRALTETAGQAEALAEARVLAGHALDAADAELAAATAGVKDTAQLTQAVEHARAAVATRRSTVEAAAGEGIRTRQTLEQLHAAAAELVTLRANHANTNQRLDLLRLAERMYGRDGIPTLIAENTIPVLEAEANRILDRMPLSDGTVMRVELHTQRALKSADHLRETLDILVTHRDLTRRFDLSFPPSHSGGEAFRVSFALRWSLAKLMRNRVDAEIGILMIDEPDGLDAAGMEALATILQDEAATFPCVLLVSHNPQLATAFEQTIEVGLVDGVSRILTPAREPVAA